MTGYIQWPIGHEFKQGDVVLNGGLLWFLDDDGKFRILDNELLPICGGCGQRKQPNVLKAHQRECEGRKSRC